MTADSELMVTYNQSQLLLDFLQNLRLLGPIYSHVNSAPRKQHALH